LDASGNAIADSGGQAIAEQLKKSFGVQFDTRNCRHRGLNGGDDDEFVERLRPNEDYSKDRIEDIFEGASIVSEVKDTSKSKRGRDDGKDPLHLELADILNRLQGLGVGSKSSEMKAKKTDCDSNLIALNLSRNNLGPVVTSNLMAALVAPCCTITDLDISGNPLGMFMSAKGEISSGGSLEIRPALTKCKSLTKLNLDRAQLPVEQVLATIGGVGLSKSLKELRLQSAMVDEPCCFQLSHSIARCKTLEILDLGNTVLGPKGGGNFLAKLHHAASRLRFLDLSGSLIGPTCATPLSRVLTDPSCVLNTLHMAKNVLGDSGGQILARALSRNASITSLDLSSNELTPGVTRILGRAVRGIFEHGHKVADCPWRKVLLNNNRGIGTKAAKVLIRALADLRSLNHLELVDIGAGPGSAQIIGKVMKDAALAWQYLNISQNDFGRVGMNQIFWALMVNRSIRVMLCSDNKPGPKFCTDADTLPNNGICLPRTLRGNPMLRELDLSYNGLSSEAGIIVLDAVVDNFSIRKLNLRGNLFDDEVAGVIGDVIRLNDIIEDLDLGDNKMGFECLLTIGDALKTNHALKVLHLDMNRYVCTYVNRYILLRQCTILMCMYRRSYSGLCIVRHTLSL
jgi:Ran GTPase-activating protein (RanGAP) involved in mRNA processing and transport